MQAARAAAGQGCWLQRGSAPCCPALPPCTAAEAVLRQRTGHTQPSKAPPALPSPRLQAVAYRSLWGFPNNYAMTKRLTEHLLLDAFAEGLPVRIVRPSIVGGTSLHHVMPGYIGNAGGELANPPAQINHSRTQMEGSNAMPALALC